MAIREIAGLQDDVPAYFARAGRQRLGDLRWYQRIGERPIGSLTFAVQGTDADVDRVIERLRTVTTVTEHQLAGHTVTGEM